MEEEFSKLNQGVDGFKEQSWLYLIEPSKKEKKELLFSTTCKSSGVYNIVYLIKLRSCIQNNTFRIELPIQNQLFFSQN